jgi:hypothetical protein
VAAPILPVSMRSVACATGDLSGYLVLSGRGTARSCPSLRTAARVPYFSPGASTIMGSARKSKRLLCRVGEVGVSEAAGAVAEWRNGGMVEWRQIG